MTHQEKNPQKHKQQRHILPRLLLDVYDVYDDVYYYDDDDDDDDDDDLS